MSNNKPNTMVGSIFPTSSTEHIVPPQDPHRIQRKIEIKIQSSEAVNVGTLGGHMEGSPWSMV